MTKTKMTSRSDFHESYYDHICAIIPQKDVLQTDIIGHSYLTSFKRWWNDLFLLSYGDRRSQVYFTSSHAMRMERVRQYRRYRSRIHPFSKFRNFWDCLMLIVFILNKFLFHHNTSVIFGEHSLTMIYIAITTEAIILIDLLVNLQTGFVNKEIKRVYLNTKKGLIRYFTTNFFLHCASALPLQAILYIRIGDETSGRLCKTNYFTCILRILNVFSLYRVYETTEYLIRARDSSKTAHFYKFLRIIILGFITMLQLFDMRDTIGLVNIISGRKITRKSYYTRLLLFKFGQKVQPSLFRLTCWNFGRIIKSLFLFSFGLATINYYMDVVFSLVSYLISNIFYMWCFLECFAFMNWLKFPEDQVIINRSMALDVVHCRQLPDKLCQKVKKFYDFKMSNERRIQKVNGLYTSLPQILKDEEKFHSYKKHIMRIPFFTNWPMIIVEAMVLMLKENIYLCDDVIVEPWATGKGLFIVDVGELAVYSAHKREAGHLIDGDYFGELSLVTDKEVRMSYVIASTSCKILILPKTAFRMLMRDYPDLFFMLRNDLTKKFSNSSCEEEA